MINPTAQTLRDLFVDRVRYAVPVYQRPYVWNKEEHWEPLWEDVREMAERYGAGAGTPSGHFLGAIVIELVNDAPGRVREYTVIDGQQRLTTLQLLLSAFREVATEHGHDSVEEVASLLRNTGRHAEGDLRFKVWPGRFDRSALRTALEGSTGNGAASCDHQISGARSFFRGRITGWLEADGSSSAERLDALHDALDGLMQVVSIQLDGTSDAQVVFETLNSRGADLTSLDLVKNALLHLAGREGHDLTALHDTCWDPAFGDADYWLEQVRQGRYTRERTDLFLMHWLTMKLGAPPRSQHLFADFRNKILRREPAPRLDELIPEICSDAKAMRSFDDLDPSEPEGRFFRRLDQMDTTTLLPVALLLFRTSELSIERRRRALATLESWLVRRMLLGATTQHYNRLLSRLLAELNSQPSLAEADVVILDALRTYQAETDRWPGDGEVLARIEGQPLYSWINQKRIGMLFEACENHMAEEGGGEMLGVPDGLTVEHALPQQWQEHWPLPEDIPDPDGAAADRDQRVHLLGNLTLVTQKLNSALSNASWAMKREALAKRSQLLVNQRLCAHETWNEELIDARGADLISRILATWPGPDAPSWDNLPPS